MNTWLQDLRFGLRMLAKNPGFTAVAVLTLALGIGANTAIFTMIDAIMLRNLPVKNPEQLVLFYDGPSAGNVTSNALENQIYSYPVWEYLREHNVAFTGLCAFRQGSDRLAMQVVSSNSREQVTGHLVSGTYFAVLGVRATVGRTLTPADDKPSASPSAVISYEFWRRRFHLDPSVVGKAVDLNGTVFTIVGVAPPEFFGERVRAAPDFWLPLSWQPQVLQQESWLTNPYDYWLNLMGRLKPGVTIDQAQSTVNTQFHQFYTAQAGTRVTPQRLAKIMQSRIHLSPGARGISYLRFMYSKPLHVLIFVVATLLLIACGNVSALMLARGSARGRELSVRLALGAQRSRLIRQLLTESLLLAMFGAMAGVMLAVWGVHVLVAIFPLSSVVKLGPDLPVLGFATAVSVLTGVLSGLLPALRSSRVGTPSAGTITSDSNGGALFKPAYALVALQVALSSVLLVAAALLTHSLLELERQNLGFNPDKVLLVRTDPRLGGLQHAELLPLYRQLQERLNSLPGVTSAAIARFSPVSGSVSKGNFSLEGYQPSAGGQIDVFKLEVGPGFFETLRIPLLLGRTIGTKDTPASPLVAVVNQTFVREFLPHQNPLGCHLSMGAPFKAPGAEIIGVAADSKYYSMREKPEPMVFFSIWQEAAGSRVDAGEVIIRVAQNPAGIIDEVKRTIRQIDPRLPITHITTLDDQLRDSLRDERMITYLCNLFGALAFLLACVGLYGMVSYSVARRTNEIGLRMALGAQRSNVVWMFIRTSAAWVASGLVLGVPAGAAASHWIRSFLFGLPPIDWMAIGSSVLAMVMVAALAAYVPARRAAKVDPMVALRYE